MPFERFEWKQCRNDLAVIAGMTLWAVIGNALYTGEAWGRTNNFNWFFVTRDPFYILPEQLAPYIMSFLNSALFFAVELLIYAVLSVVRQVSNQAGRVTSL